jgi:hypothetical protein
MSAALLPNYEGTDGRKVLRCVLENDDWIYLDHDKGHERAAFNTVMALLVQDNGGTYPLIISQE